MTFKSHYSVFYLFGKNISRSINYLFESSRLCLECVCNSARKVRPVEEVGSKIEFGKQIILYPNTLLVTDQIKIDINFL